MAELDEEDEASLKTAETMMEMARPRIRSAIDDAMSGGGGGVRTDPIRVLQSLTDPKGPISQLPVKGLTTLSQRFGSILLARAAGRLDKAAHKIRTESRSRSEAMLDQVFDTTSSSDGSSGRNGGGKRRRSDRGINREPSNGSSLALLRTVESPPPLPTADFELSNNNDNNNDLVTELVTERVAERTMALWALVLESARKGIEPSLPSPTVQE